MLKYLSSFPFNDLGRDRWFVLHLGGVNRSLSRDYFLGNIVTADIKRLRRRDYAK